MLKFFQYLFEKRGDLLRLDAKDAVLTKAVLDIHRKRSGKEQRVVELHSVRPIHRLDRPSALEKTAERTAALERAKAELLSLGTLRTDDLIRFIPSVSAIKVVEDRADCYLAFEGNGRLGALHQVFSPDDRIQIEVEIYRFDRRRDRTKIVRRLHRVRRFNNLPAD